jgi:hypothetical protein
MAGLREHTHSSPAALRSIRYSTAPVRHLPEIHEIWRDQATATGMVGRPAMLARLSGNYAIDAGQAGVSVGRHMFVQPILLEALHSERLDTWVVSTAVRWE